jgi:hypothetical protein
MIIRNQESGIRNQESGIRKRIKDKFNGRTETAVIKHPVYLIFRSKIKSYAKNI